MKPKLRIIAQEEPTGPSRNFLCLTRNIDLALKPPVRFEPTKKAEGDVVI